MSDLVTTVKTPQILALADGATPTARSNAQGHCFEKFMARVFEAYGCLPPTHSSLNVTSNGYELDIVTTLKLTGERAIAECKAYTSNVPIDALNTFYGKVSTERLEGQTLHGWFVAIPGLTDKGYVLARRIEKSDTRFRLIDADALFQLLKEKAWITSTPPTPGPHSDFTIIVTEHGVYSAVKQLDPTTRLPIAIQVWSASGTPVPLPVRKLISESDYAAGVEVADSDLQSNRAPHADSAPNPISVVGSSGDFEYQYPASPAFFIGRTGLVSTVEDHLRRQGGGTVLVLNAQSGWGKSSFALRIAHSVESLNGSASVFDVRTASSPQYVWAAIRLSLQKAQERKLLHLPLQQSFGSLRSCVETLRRCDWRRRAPLLIFFDQFENIFRDPLLTREFRDFALAVRELPSPVVLGFAWKTDLVGWTEKYPYQLRDEIRAAAEVLTIPPFGPAELSTILSRLATAASVGISLDLRQRLREYSQGLPWLIKKLASHVLKQLRAGTSEEALIADSLSIQTLFEADLAGLTPREEKALRLIAKEAPVPVADIVERVSPDIVQSLVDQRLLVRVGERLDTYWDTFRDFLVSGRVAVAETYTLRQNPVSTARLLHLIASHAKPLSSNDAALHLDTSATSVQNLARDLRQLGLIVSHGGVLSLARALRGEPVTEDRVRHFVASALRKHKVFQAITEHLKKSPRGFSLGDLAKELSDIFPAVEATDRTWRQYAAAFARWYAYAGLFDLRGQELYPATSAPRLSLLGRGGRGKRKTFPQGNPRIAVELLAGVAGIRKVPKLPDSVRDKALNDLVVLGLLGSAGNIVTNRGLQMFDSAGRIRTSQLLDQVGATPGAREALAALRKAPRLDSAAVGEILRSEQGAVWAPTTASTAGKVFRQWARYLGVPLERPRLKRSSKTAQQKIAADGASRRR